MGPSVEKSKRKWKASPFCPSRNWKKKGDGGRRWRPFTGSLSCTSQACPTHWATRGWRGWKHWDRCEQEAEGLSLSTAWASHKPLREILVSADAASPRTAGPSWRKVASKWARGNTPGFPASPGGLCVAWEWTNRGSQVVLAVKNPPANAEDIRVTGLIPRLGRSPGGGHGNPLQYSPLERPHRQRSLVG